MSALMTAFGPQSAADLREIRRKGIGIQKAALSPAIEVVGAIVPLVKDLR